MEKTAAEKRSINIVLMGFTSLINDISSGMIDLIYSFVYASMMTMAGTMMLFRFNRVARKVQ
ncbi:MAG: hypothetical protein NTY68_05085 [Candidatus Micrarchaeota archaeon]|nr:hypothetical protein [Candidatus Micrarchaeota archaeon]